MTNPLVSHPRRALFVGSGLLLCLSAAIGSFRAETYKVIAWNDLGMHCMDGDYSVFSLLPPFNTVVAQVIDKDGKLVKSDAGLRVTYEAVADPAGSINKSSAGKTNYWQHAQALYGGSSTPDTGLAGKDMPGASNTPQAMHFDVASSQFIAEGIPVTPYDDQGHVRRYPMMRIVVRDASNTQLAASDVVLPVSDEMDCSSCHASGTSAAAEPVAGWIHDRDAERDFRLNILRLHDERNASDPIYQAALQKAGYAPGLYDSVVKAGKPVLCAACHLSNALPGSGDPTVSALTSALHKRHANVLDPVTNKRLDDATNRAACYHCHPGSDTRCLRGAMGAAVASDGTLAMQCQDCHGNMSAVGDAQRVGWLDQPSCQNCHTGTATRNNGQIRYDSAFETNGQRRVAVDATFATNPDVPSRGFDLYRFSKGHGGLSCEACHGSTHAVYPSIHANDNVQSKALQGHAGTIAECSACHKETPEVWLSGPHGLHPIGQEWVDWHGDAAERLGYASCAPCHGTDARSTVLSQMHADRTLTSKYGAKSFFRGANVTCYACHNGPRSERTNPNRAPVVQNARAQASSAAVQIPLVASDADNDALQYRVVSQAHGGLVTIQGSTATYTPTPGFSGEDSFTFAAFDGDIDSNLGTVTVERAAHTVDYGVGYPGTQQVVPKLVPRAAPKIGTTMSFQVQNSSGVDTAVLLVMAFEPAGIRTPFGGRLLAQPTIVISGGLPAAGTDVALPIPGDNALVGGQLNVQAVQLDLGARYGYSFTPGLRLLLGR